MKIESKLAFNAIGNFSDSAIPDPLTLSIVATLNTSSKDCQQIVNPCLLLIKFLKSVYLVKA
jgi:hypothetical protein